MSGVASAQASPHAVRALVELADLADRHLESRHRYDAELRAFREHISSHVKLLTIGCPFCEGAWKDAREQELARQRARPRPRPRAPLVTHGRRRRHLRSRVTLAFSA